MARLSDSLNIILKHEGGYTCAFTGSGETYKGIDRNYSKEWKGWQIVDDAKRRRVIDATCKKFGQVINNNTLEALVNNWYSLNLLKYFENFGAIQNQQVANLMADFMWHKPYRAIPIANNIARFLKPNVIANNNLISNDVISVINARAADFYTMFRNMRINYYLNPTSINSSWPERFVKSQKGLLIRATSFPKTISNNNISWLFN